MGSRWRRSVAAALTCALVVALSGCGSSATEAGAPDGSTTTASTSAPATASTATTTTAPTVPDGPVDVVVISTPYGDALGTGTGLALYTWDEEADGTVECIDAECVEVWPPLLAEEIGTVGDLDPARFTLVDRPDGTSQVALDAHPLYLMAGDGPGEASCQGVEGWWLVSPDGTKNANETPRGGSPEGSAS